MKKILVCAIIMSAINSSSFAQENKSGSENINVPEAVKNANMKKYPESKAHHITWEKENGNYEANWGGKDGEANSVQYTPAGAFIEIVKEIPVQDLPKGVTSYAKEHYNTTKFGDVGKVLDVNGKII
jgi:hypothetical protein